MFNRHRLKQLALASLFLAPSLLVADAGQLVGTWQCQQQLTPDPQIRVQLKYEHQFNPNRQFNLAGQLTAGLGNNTLAYRFRGDGDWSLEGQRLLIATANSEFLPDNATAQQFHDLGILKADQFNNLQSQDYFEIIKLNHQELQLKHTREDFMTRCQRL